MNCGALSILLCTGLPRTCSCSSSRGPEKFPPAVPVWGQIMKAGFQNSRFAHQVERFACLYTSQVGNLGLYSPNKYYRPVENFMVHESNVLSL
ncbi:putative HAD-superfamily hydrolase, subfamily IG, 5'-nucleotidase, HAD-like superfamily [Helianthus annuus]|nr:putative HAD-superfamily hydrolase, subfamily IG, 5'-nucleotidase, HAD-like superfamily [Helianthus annuus]KAJ0760585.1 putative HAD-superfamily hydrolase, subfamily IG, 5'-nucleotidase, HAD-like superfamily [Helianthus annuus]